MYKIDVQKFKKVFPNSIEPDKFCNLLDNLLPAAGIDTKERINMFLAQCGHCLAVCLVSVVMWS